MFDSVTAYKMLTCDLELLILERVPLDSIRANYEGKKPRILAKGIRKPILRYQSHQN